MLRNKDIPQGVKADRLGYPTKRLGGPHVSTSERRSLLREYSDGQLDSLNTKLQRSEGFWKTVKIGGFTLAATAFVAKGLAMGAGLFELQHGLPYDPVTSAILEVYKGEMSLLSHVGVTDTFTQIMTSVYGVSIGLPLVAGITGQSVQEDRSKQQLSVENELEKRELISILQASQVKQNTDK